MFVVLEKMDKKVQLSEFKEVVLILLKWEEEEVVAEVATKTVVINHNPDTWFLEVIQQTANQKKVIKG